MGIFTHLSYFIFVLKWKINILNLIKKVLWLKKILKLIGLLIMFGLVYFALNFGYVFIIAFIYHPFAA